MPGPGYKAKSKGGPGYTGRKKVRQAVSKAVSRGKPVSSSTYSPPPSPPASTQLVKSKPKLTRAQRIERIQRQYRKGKRTLPGLDTEQTRVASKVLEQGERAGATRKELVAAAATGLVESGMRNLDYGDRDSLGWRQERASLYPNPRNLKASAKRFFQETAAAGRGKGVTAGTLAQSVQRSAYPERYDERKREARKIVKAYTRGRKSGPRKLPGPYEGSRRFVRKLVGTKVRGDKEPGHSTGGMHDPANPRAYAQDINMPGGNPSEREPGYDQQTVSRIVRNLRKRGADIPKDFKLGRDWTGVVDGYEVELFTAPHGTGPHIHIGAEWTGESSSGGSSPQLTGGTGGSAPGGPSLTASGAGSPPGRAGQSPAARRRERERKRLLREILSRRVFPVEQPPKPERSTRKRSTRKRTTKVSLGL